MNKTAQISIALFLLIALIIGFAKWQKGDVNEALISSNSCYIEDLSCQFDFSDGYLRIKFEQMPEVEEEINIFFEQEGNVEIVDAFVSGVNMYMGRTPVMLDKKSSDNNLKGVFFLGSCNVDNMQWKMQIRYRESPNQEQIQFVELFFRT